MGRKRRASARQIIEHFAKAEHDPLVPGSHLQWGRPEIRRNDVGEFVVWHTLCNRYSIARIDGIADEPRFMAFRREESEQFHGGMSDEEWAAAGKPVVYRAHDVSLVYDTSGRPKSYRNLADALAAILENFRIQTGNPTATSDNVIVQDARECGLSKLPPRSQDMAAVKNENGVVIPKFAVVSLMQELGFANITNNVPVADLAKRVKNLPSIIDEETQPKTDSGRKLLEKITKAVADKIEITISGGGETAAKPGKKKTAGAKPPKAAKKTSGKKPTPAEPADLDDFGSRKGTDLAKANAVLSKTEGLTMGEVVKKAKLVRTVYGHFKRLMEAKKVVKKDGKYYIK
jgi:hypothetical protein